MIEFWAVLGRFTFDPKFHEQVHPLANPLATHLDEVPNLQTFLFQQNFRLSRWEVMEINRILSTRKGALPDTIEIIPDPAKDVDILRVRAGWPLGAPVDLLCHIDSRQGTDRFELCAVLGLALIDTQFRKAIHDASVNSVGVSELNLLLVNTTGTSPRFNLIVEELEWIQAWIQYTDNSAAAGPKSMMERLQSYEARGWEQPNMITGGCSTGSTFKCYFFPNEAHMGLRFGSTQAFSAELDKGRASLLALVESVAY